jgi:hypothetical protein
MTARLYDRRVALYPSLFVATEPFRMSRLDSALDLKSHVSDALEKVEQWGAQKGGLILSEVAYERFLELRLAVRRLIHLIDTGNNNDCQELKREVWTCKNRLRAAIRDDLGLMFDEDQPMNTRERSK